MLLIHLLAIAHLAAADPGSEVLKGAAKAAPEVCKELRRTGPVLPDPEDPGSGRPMSADSAQVFESIKDMKPVGGVMDPTALGLLGMLADMSEAENEADSIAAAQTIRKLAPGAVDKSNRSRAAETLGCIGAQGGD